MNVSGRRSRILFALSVAAAPLALFALGSSEVDPDLFWHLEVARQIERGGVRPLIDQFSYNSISEPWLPYSWLAELGMLRIVESMNARSLVWVPLLCYGSVLVLIGLTVMKDAGTSFKSAVIVLVGGLLILPFIGLRPATLAFPLCALSVWLVVGTVDSKLRPLALAAIVPLTILLANIHLFFLFPPLVLLARGAPFLISKEPHRRREGALCLVLAALALTGGLALNPFGLELASVIVHYTSSDVMVQARLIDEMRPFYEMGMPVAFVAPLMLLWPVAGVIRGGKWPGLHEVTFFGLALALLLAHGRYAPLAVLVAAPLAARYGPWPGPALAKRLEPVFAGTATALVAFAGLTVLTDRVPSRLDAYLESETEYPVAAARFVRDSVPRASGRLINEFGWGGYLIYALWPDFRVLIDGRTQVYPEHLWRALYVNPTYASRLEVFERADADVAILRRDSPWSEPLREGLGWRIIYEDSVSKVWVSPGLGETMLSSLE